MVAHAPARARTGTLRLAALVGLAVMLRRHLSSSPAYTVKGGWQGKTAVLRGTKGDLDTVLGGLEPNVSFPGITYKRKGLALSVADGHLNADYTTELEANTTLDLRVNDAQDWEAKLKAKYASLRVKGHSNDLDTLFWEAAQEGYAEDLGDVKVEFNSDKAYNLTVNRPLLAQVGGVDVGAKVRATNEGFTGRLEAKTKLPEDVEVKYAVENPVGVYGLGSSKHDVKLTAPLAGGSLLLEAKGNSKAQEYVSHYTHAVDDGLAVLNVTQKDGVMGYNASYTRGLALAQNSVVDTDMTVGVDRLGAYGRFIAKRPIGKGVEAKYEALGRFAVGGKQEAKLMHTLRLSNKLGYAQLFHSRGEAPRLRVGYEFDAKMGERPPPPPPKKVLPQV